MIEYFICAVCQRHMPAYIFGFRVMLIWGTRGNAALCVCVCGLETTCVITSKGLGCWVVFCEQNGCE
jgi:hypothetical protein